jgi:hypothetical protein
MARLLTILFIGLICEAIGVVLLSRGLKEILSFFSAGEIRDAAALTSQLTSPTHPLSGYLWQKFTPAQQAQLTAASPDEAKRRALAAALNEALPDDSLYSPDRFAGVSLSPATRTLLRSKREASETLHFNRLLLEDAFPGELAKVDGQKVSVSQSLRLVGRGVSNAHIVLGVFFEALFFVGLLMLMSKADVSFLWPLTSLSFVVTTIAAKIYLHEQVSAVRWSGVCLIMMGAALITWSEKHSPPVADETPVLQSTGTNALPPQ